MPTLVKVDIVTLSMFWTGEHKWPVISLHPGALAITSENRYRVEISGSANYQFRLTGRHQNRRRSIWSKNVRKVITETNIPATLQRLPSSGSLLKSSK